MLNVPEEIRDAVLSLQLPSIPQILLRFLELADDDSASMADLALLVGQDPALSARLLTVANSVVFRRGKATSNLGQCLVMLGLRLARTLATCLLVQRVFAPASTNRQCNYAGFWKHSLHVAEMSRAIAGIQGQVDPEEAYLAGLLHDVGQLLLLAALDERYAALLASCGTEDSLVELEQQHLDTDHGTVAAWMIDRWEIPSSFLADAILFHHAPWEKVSDADPLTRIVWSAHAICRLDTINATVDDDGPLPDLFCDSLPCTLDEDTIQRLRRDCRQRLDRIIQALDFDDQALSATMPVVKGMAEAAGAQGAAKQELAPLEDKVRDLALIQPLQRDLVSVKHEGEILDVLGEASKVLFGFSAVAFWLQQRNGITLIGSSGNGTEALTQQLEIPLSSEHSLAALAMREKRYCCSLATDELPAGVSDIQIARLLKSAGVLYIPLLTGGMSIGVMACGVHPMQFHRMQHRMPWLMRFAATAAGSIVRWREMQAVTGREHAVLREDYTRHARQIVHETGNPLGIMKNYLSLLRKKLPDSGIIDKELKVLDEEIDRISSILQRMGQEDAARPEPGLLDVNGLIENMLLLYGEALFTARRITLQVELDPTLPGVPCDRERLKQIFLNLWHNAAEILQEGSLFTITTRDDMLHEGYPCIEIRLKDNGPGLPEHVLQQLFSPLDAASRRPGHAGLGLSIVWSLVREMGGWITCSSKAGTGTEFSLLLPRTRPAAP